MFLEKPRLFQIFLYVYFRNYPRIPKLCRDTRTAVRSWFRLATRCLGLALRKTAGGNKVSQLPYHWGIPGHHWRHSCWLVMMVGYTTNARCWTDHSTYILCCNTNKYIYICSKHKYICAITCIFSNYINIFFFIFMIIIIIFSFHLLSLSLLYYYCFIFLFLLLLFFVINIVIVIWYI
jgi:cellulose synthase/poly-beta-1,6-N-acetylglucosamine synthase-like glycosyltransferase